MFLYDSYKVAFLRNAACFAEQSGSNFCHSNESYWVVLNSKDSKIKWAMRTFFSRLATWSARLENQSSQLETRYSKFSSIEDRESSRVIRISSNSQLTSERHCAKQCNPVVLFIMLYKVVLTLEPVDEILKCNNSNESYYAVLSCGAVYYAVQDDSNFGACGWNPKVWQFKWKLLRSTFLWCCLLCCTRWF